MRKLAALFALFRQGGEVANAAAWKNGQIEIAKLSGFVGAVLAVLGAFGLAVPASPEQITAIAGGVLALVAVANGVLTVITSKKVGLPAGPESAPGAGESERSAGPRGSNQPY